MVKDCHLHLRNYIGIIPSCDLSDGYDQMATFASVSKKRGGDDEEEDDTMPKVGEVCKNVACLHAELIKNDVCLHTELINYTSAADYSRLFSRVAWLNKSCGGNHFCTRRRMAYLG